MEILDKVIVLSVVSGSAVAYVLSDFMENPQNEVPIAISAKTHIDSFLAVWLLLAPKRLSVP